jgi:hypothetical protein
MKIVKFNKKKIILILLIKKILKALNKAVYLNNLTFKIPIFTTKIDFNHLFLIIVKSPHLFIFKKMKSVTLIFNHLLINHKKSIIVILIIMSKKNFKKLLEI